MVKTESLTAYGKSNVKKDFYILIAIAFRIVLDWSYVILSSTGYAQEFSLRTNVAKLIISYITFIPICYFTYNKKNISAFFIRILVFFTIIPLSSVYALRDESSSFYLLVIMTFLIAEFFIFMIRRPKRKEVEDKQKVIGNSLGNAIIIAASILIVVVAMLLMYKENGLPSLSTLDLSEVYNVRENYVASKYLSYLVGLSTMVVVPFLFAIGCENKSPLLILLAIVIQLTFFLWTGHKTWLFSILLFLYVLVIVKKKLSLNIIFGGVVAISFLLCAFYNLNSTILREGFFLINRRVLLEPAALKFFYYDFFLVEGNKTIGLSGTILAPIESFLGGGGSTYNYTEMIGFIYTGMTSNAGTGLYGGDIANLGWGAFVVVPLLIIFLCDLAELSHRYNGREFTLLLFTYIVYFFADQRIFSYFLDLKGLFIVVIVLVYRNYAIETKTTLVNMGAENAR